MSENASVRFGRWWTFCAHDVNWVVTLNMAYITSSKLQIIA